MDDVVIREARRSDAAVMIDLISELAVFEKLRDDADPSIDDIVRDGFGPSRRFECLLAEHEDVVVGFALFFHNYSTFEGHAGLYIEDLYIREAFRRRGIGRSFMERLGAIAHERSCPRIDLSVLAWNPARSFYERLGFVEMKDWRPYRLFGDALHRLAEGRRS